MWKLFRNIFEQLANKKTNGSLINFSTVLKPHPKRNHNLF